MAANDTELVDQLPLKGVVLCCTSLSQDVRTKLADVAGQMGATHILDLTADVTHLLVANINTPKYRYVAKERPEVRVLSPDFIEAVRKEWTEGGDVDVAALEKQYTLPTFFGLQICLTGVSDPSTRGDMEQTIAGRGGTYHGDLTKAVTHLIAAKPEGAKYTHAKQWKIRVVSIRWYEDSLARGMALEEDLYAPELPLEQQGKNAFRKRKRSISGRPSNNKDESTAGDGSRRKLRKSASMRFDSQSQDMWQSISAQEVQVEATELDVWNDESQTLKAAERPRSKDMSAISRPITPVAHLESEGIFSGQYVLIYGFNESRTKTLQRFLEPNGATVVHSPEELEEAGGNVGFQARCLMMPHDKRMALPELPPGTVLVTEWWVERCILYKRHLDPTEDLLSSPLTNTVVSGFANLRISMTGFDTDEVGMHLRQTALAIKMVGAMHDEALGSSTSVLVCNSAKVKKQKAFYAWKRKIPMVSADWLWESLKTRKMAPFDKYKIPLPSFDAADVYADPSPSASSVNTNQEKSRLPMRGSMEHAKRAADLLPPKRLSNTRKRHATPSLPLQPSRPSEQARSRAGPFILEDNDQDESPITCDDQSAPVLQTTHQPLKEISPNRSQPRSSRGGEPNNQKDDDPTGEAVTDNPPASPHRSLASPPKSPTKEPSEPKPKGQEELTSDLANILAKQMATRPTTSSLEPQKRKHRPLGRNLSTISNHSESPLVSSERSEVGDGFDVSRDVVPSLPPPGTQLGYDTPEAVAHRRKLSKQMGTSFAEEGRRVESVKTVKDSVDVAPRMAVGAGSRAKGKRAKAG